MLPRREVIHAYHSLKHPPWNVQKQKTFKKLQQTNPQHNHNITMTQANSTLKIIPLGGLHEIGKNTCVFEYNDEIMLLDAGLAFPTDGMHGVNIVLPNID